MFAADYNRKFLRLSKYATKFVPSEAESCKRFLCGLRDELKVQLVLRRVLECFDLVERAKIVEQALGLDKNTETARASRKRTLTISSHPQSKRPRDSHGS